MLLSRRIPILYNLYHFLFLFAYSVLSIESIVEVTRSIDLHAYVVDIPVDWPDFHLDLDYDLIEVIDLFIESKSAIESKSSNRYTLVYWEIIQGKRG